MLDVFGWDDDGFGLFVAPPELEGVQGALEPKNGQGRLPCADKAQHGQVMCCGDDIAKVKQRLLGHRKVD